MLLEVMDKDRLFPVMVKQRVVGDSQENVGDSKTEVHGGQYVKDDTSQDDAGKCLC